MVNEVRDRGTTTTASPRRLERAREHVCDLWFPVDKQLFSQIRAAAESGIYDQNLPGLVEQIRGDFALFTFALRELSTILRDEGVELPATTPVQLLELAGIERLKLILDTEPQLISRHSLSSSTTDQLTRFQETMISASASELMAEHYQVNADLAYSAALLRQLGMTLIAYNYSAAYQQAVLAVAEDRSKKIDSVLTQMLGFSPSMLALSVVRKWDLPAELFAALVDGDEEPPGSDMLNNPVISDESLAVSESVTKLCRVGEALARANNPGLYPEAEKDWEFARQEIERTLGARGLEEISQRIDENCQGYMSAVPHMFRAVFLLSPQERIAAQQNQAVHNRNPYIQNCRPFLKNKLEELYSGLKDGIASRDQLRKLAHQIVPSCGFYRGCVYTLDLMGGMLVPQLALGTASRDQFLTVEYQKTPNPESIVARGFIANQSVVEAVVGSAGIEVVQIAGALGASQRVGVMLLEVSKEMFVNDELAQLLHFKALCQTFNDALKLQ